MNNNNEIKQLKNNIAIKIFLKTLAYSLITILAFTLIVDFFYNDKIADYISNINRELYVILVENKTFVMAILYITIFFAMLFIVVRNMGQKLFDIMAAVDKILKEPNEEIKLSKDMIIAENKLNKIRTDLIKNQNMAKDAENRKNDLIMYMAHDLKTPLTSVIGYLTLLTEEKQISENLKEKYMKIALDKSLRVEELTNQFFEITRYNLKDMPINRQNIDISILIEQLAQECYPMLQERNLKCNITKPDHVHYLGDGDKLARAFENLLKNAINYSYKNSDIEINIVENEDIIQIVFKNKGDKIPKYKLDKIFDKFYRVDESRQSNTGGTGLGLAIAKEIVDLHNGNIYVKNDTELIEFYIELKK